MSESSGTLNSRRLARAFDHHRAGRHRRAARACSRILKEEPDNIDAICLMAIARFECGERQEAAELLARARARHPDSRALNDACTDLCLRAGDYNAALPALRAALIADPERSELHLRLGVALDLKGDYLEAVAAYRRALEIQPGLTQARLKLAESLKNLGHTDAALTELTAALDNAPGNPDAAGALAEFYEQLNRVVEAGELARTHLQRFPGDPRLSLVAARCMRRSGQFREALDLLDSLTDKAAGTGDAAAQLYEKGTLLDKLDQPRAAMEAFRAANSIVARAWQETHPGPNAYARKVAQLSAAFTADLVSGWDGRSAPAARASPAFLVGFPRSGTTLLDQILDSHPATQVIEERGLIAVVEHELAMQGPFPEILATLSQAQTESLRERYFELAETQVRLHPGRLLIDKLPLNITNAGLIFRLFPDARFIFALRHPADVCLSCFMQNFRPTDAMANFFDLASTVRLYTSTMALWALYRQRLPLIVHSIRYEDLIADLSGEARGLLDFLGLEWNEAVLEFHKHARSRARINTPSYHQVSQPIYSEARFRWHRYREQLEPFLPQLAPWISAFGYAGDRSHDAG